MKHKFKVGDKFISEIVICGLYKDGYRVKKDDNEIFIYEKHLENFFDKIKKEKTMPAKKKAPAKKKMNKKV